MLNTPNAIIVEAGSSGILSIQGSTYNQTFSGNITLNNNLTLAQLGGVLTTTFNGTITGGSALNIGNTGITNSGIVALTGSSNGTFTGNTTINGGTLNFGSGGLGNDTGTITLRWGSIPSTGALRQVTMTITDIEGDQVHTICDRCGDLRPIKVETRHPAGSKSPVIGIHLEWMCADCRSPK